MHVKKIVDDVIEREAQRKNEAMIKHFLAPDPATQGKESASNLSRLILDHWNPAPGRSGSWQDIVTNPDARRYLEMQIRGRCDQVSEGLKDHLLSSARLVQEARIVLDKYWELFGNPGVDENTVNSAFGLLKDRADSCQRSEEFLWKQVLTESGAAMIRECLLGGTNP